MEAIRIHEDYPEDDVENIAARKMVGKRTASDVTRCALRPLENRSHPTARDALAVVKTTKNHLKLSEKINQENQKPNHQLNLAKEICNVKPATRLGEISRVGAIRDIVSATKLEYQQEIFSYLLEAEQRFAKIKPKYMTKQVHLDWHMRSILVDWLVSVADEYTMNEQTIHLSVNYLDRFLSNISVVRDKFQLVGASAMVIAAKVEEIYPPELKEWSYLTGDTFTVRQFLKMEQFMLKVLQFELNTPTMLDFIEHLSAKMQFDTKTTHLAMYLSELVLLEGDAYLKEKASKLASASIALARHTLCQAEPWNQQLESTSGYTLKQLSPVVVKQHKTFKSSPFKSQQAIQKKYSTDRFGRVALLKPRSLNLEEDDCMDC